MSDQLQDEQKVHKIVIVGGGGVGKSCITLRFLHDHFEDKYNPTIEDSYMKNNFMVDGVAHNIEIFDTAGQDTFAAMRDRYYMEGHGFLIVYSVTDSTSLQDAKDRYEGILTVTEATPQTCKPVMLIGNKCDLENDRVISKEQGKEAANEWGGGRIGHYETSAKSNINVTEVFQEIVRMMLKEDAAHGLKKPKKPKKKSCSIL